MSGQDVFTLEDPLFQKLETWQRENPVRRRVTSTMIEQEHGNFITFSGTFSRRPPAEKENYQDGDVHLYDDKGSCIIRPTRFIDAGLLKQVFLSIIILNRKQNSAKSRREL